MEGRANVTAVDIRSFRNCSTSASTHDWTARRASGAWPRWRSIRLRHAAGRRIDRRGAGLISIARSFERGLADVGADTAFTGRVRPAFRSALSASIHPMRLAGPAYPPTCGHSERAAPQGPPSLFREPGLPGESRSPADAWLPVAPCIDQARFATCRPASVSAQGHRPCLSRVAGASGATASRTGSSCGPWRGRTSCARPRGCRGSGSRPA